MEDTTLITIEDIKNVTAISNNIDVEVLEPWLATSQDIYIRPLVGDALMDAMIASVASNGTGYTGLIDNYILRPLAFAAWHDSDIFLHVKTQKKGLVTQASSDSTTASDTQFSNYSQRIEGKMTFYLNKLKDYLDTSAAKILYPLYTSSEQINPQNSSSIFLGY